ncbi:MAG: mitochondrial fission ELM1 family protein [Candidatus Omnitrophica bacterium]|nr:mitochondrial fission ELM1 family protein [Candidatus Omnitrophota bacterium]
MKILIPDDGNKGNLTQSLGIAENISDDLEIFRVMLKGPSYFLPKRKGTYKLIGKVIGLVLFLNLISIADFLLRVFSNIKEMDNKKYDIIISTGSYLAPVNATLSITKKIFSVCVLTPEGTPLRFFNFVFVPKHDVLKHPCLKKNKNIITTIGAPNRINQTLITQWGIRLSRGFNVQGDLYKIGIIIGGNDQNYFIDKQFIDRIFTLLIYNLNNKKAGFFLTTSRRTPLDVVYLLKEKTENNSSFIYCEFPGLSRESFYFGILGLSDILLVTEDSVNMISESCSTGKPVLILGVQRRKNKKIYFDETIKELVEKNYCMYLPYEDIHLLQDKISECKNRKFNRLNEAQTCAEIIRKKIK